MKNYKYVISKADLEDYYVKQELSTNEIALIYGCNNGTIWYRLVRYGITPRSNKVASTVGWPKAGRVIPLDIDKITRMYLEEKMPTKLIGRKFGCSKWLIADRLQKAGVPLRKKEVALTDFGRAILWSPEVIKKRSAGERAWWQGDPHRKNIRAQKMALAVHRKPNKPELAVQIVLDSLFPSDWKYVGDGQVIIDGLNPDFINVNGKKLIIEVFGDYWHGERVTVYHRTEKGRIEAYQKYGYRTLIVWERETKDSRMLADKITQFIAGDISV